MPFKDTAIAQAWRRAHKLKLRDALRAERIANPRERRGALHPQLGIKTFVHRQAILPDFRHRLKFDPVSWSRSNNHLYRESITLAGAT